MTDLDQLQPGPELDRMIAVEVMGWDLVEIPAGTRIGNDPFGAMLKDWSPSTNIAHAWEVVRKFKEQGFCVKESDMSCLALYVDEAGKVITGECATAPRAICICALKVVRDK